MGLALGVSLPVFWPGLVSLVAAWLTPEYSHGPLIPLISLFLFLREMRDAPAPPDAAPDRRPGLALGVVALLLALAGNRTGIPDLVTYGLILWVMALVLAAMGWTRGRRHWASVFHLIFMLPLPQVVFWQVSTALQTVSAEIGVALVTLAGVPVLLEGHVIDLGVYKLQVAEACSGLRYLFPILSFSYLVAILYRGPFAHKALLFLMAAPLAVLLNAARIGVIGILVDRFGIAHAEGFSHLFEGWVVFGLCLAILLGTARALAAFRGTTGPMLDLDTDGLARQAAHLPAIGGAGALAGLALMAAGALALDRPAPAPDDIARAPLAPFPMRIGAWDGQRASLDDETRRVLAASDTLVADYVAPGAAAPVSLFVAWYARQTNGAGLHSPEVCLPAGGWEIAELRQQSVPQGFEVNRAVIRKGLERQLVWYWFEQRGTRLTSAWQAKFSALRDGLVAGRSDGTIVRLVTRVRDNEAVDQAEARLQGFLDAALPQIAGHLPE
ncbi:VPLPA-CTERM-specific exosortase XrtD [Jannaschia sp. GRR-S6-38]|uniref:VPLPA-CTERM-specific exosortase XrtD n=1 Tax=Jannaschia ovalis TaxID=3038773 RepID=A0ABY8LJL7_9RHOB|nr:VPLPA-CTERM-specific exosortase XrtD [Jannaschia sp. GRR-S6-38]WGH80360.1 VPLPA-CTERM-specific exosortase XrtD [Jannaschia sp. GRR-S6-38]